MCNSKLIVQLKPFPTLAANGESLFQKKEDIKMLKKKFLLFFSLMLTFSLFSSSLALANPIPINNSTLKEVKQSKTNEYQYIKELQQKDIKDLEKLGFTGQEITSIKELDYVKELKRRATLDDKTLKGMGYDDTKITQLRNYIGTEAQTMALAATCTVSLWMNYYYYEYSPNRTYFNAQSTWSWDYEPMNTLTDIFALAWSPALYQDVPGSSYNKVWYWDTNTQSYRSPVVTTPEPSSGIGTQSKFTVLQGDQWVWAKCGETNIYLSASGNIHDIAMKSAYGHQILSLGGVSCSLNGTPGMSFSYNMEQEPSYGYIHKTN